MKKGTLNFLRYWLPVIVYCLLIFLQSSRPSLERLPDVAHMDKFLHVTAYALLGILFFRAFKTAGLKGGLKQVILVSVLSTAAYGVSDELHQHFVPFRNADPLDAIADTVGGICGVCAGHFLTRKVHSRIDKFLNFI
jgi:VanZ family protein